MGMPDKRVYLTRQGLEELKKEYEFLTQVKRSEILKRLKETRDLANLTENTAYDAALEEQGFLEKRISELSGILENATVIKNGRGRTVRLGSRVRVSVEGEEQEFFIVDAPEADPLQGRVSHDSPFGRALIGKTIGDKVEVSAPVGKITYAILRVE